MTSFVKEHNVTVTHHIYPWASHLFSSTKRTVDYDVKRTHGINYWLCGYVYNKPIYDTLIGYPVCKLLKYSNNIAISIPPTGNRVNWNVIFTGETCHRYDNTHRYQLLTERIYKSHSYQRTKFCRVLFIPSVKSYFSCRTDSVELISLMLNLLEL